MASCPLKEKRRVVERLRIWEILLSAVSVCHEKVNTKARTKNDLNLLGMVFHLSSGFVLIDTVDGRNI